MNDLTPEQIKARYASIPKELQDALTSDEVRAAIQRIGRDRGLMLDQVGDLIDQIGLVILGFAKSSEFVRDITKRLGISDQQAKELAVQINREVLDAVRRGIDANASQVQKAEERKDETDHVAAIERAGGFTIERRPAEQPAPVQQTSAAPSQPSKNLLEEQPIESKTDLIDGLENPVPAPERKEPLVEQLLRGANAMPEQNVTRPAPQPPAPATPQPPRPSGSDPYREAIG